MSDFRLLAMATLKIYQRAASRACAGCLLNWRMLFVHLGGLALFAVLGGAAQLMGPIAGGFAAGLLLAVLLGAYFFTVSGAVLLEKLEFIEIKSRGFSLFAPVLSVLFSFFLLSIAVNLVFAQGGSAWIAAVFNLLIAVFFNPLPEIIYLHPSRALDMFSESIEFIMENFIEWYLPFVLLLLPVALFRPEALLAVGIAAATTNPFRFLEKFILLFGDFSLLLHSAGVIMVLLVCCYFVFAFRGALYRELSASTRRKRIYQERFG